MADEADKAQKFTDSELALCIAAARGDIPPGVQGECELCGEWSGRLIGGACAPCRDKWGME